MRTQLILLAVVFTFQPFAARADILSALSDLKDRASGSGHSIIQDACHLIAANHGKGIDTHSSLICRAPAGRTDLFDKAVASISEVNRWENGLLPPGQEYRIYDQNGNHVADRHAQVGDYVRIQVAPAPGSLSWGKQKNVLKKFWVKVEAAEVRGEAPHRRFEIRVRPTQDPTRPPPPKVTDHFFTDDAVNRFYVQEDVDSSGRPLIRIGVHGTGESANTTQVRDWADKAYNSATANFGWVLGLQKATWASWSRNKADELGLNNSCNIGQ